MAIPDYKLSTVLCGHSLDVRCVAITKESCILSGSRDRTAKLWHPEGVKDFVNVVTYKGHNNFVSCVCWFSPCEAFPDGLVITGSNDNTIIGYNLQDGTILITLKGHENAVCSIATSRDSGILLSSSWDNTAKVWNINNIHSEPLTLKGHQAAVWAIVELGNGTYATASADKTIKLWKKDGSGISTLTGHTDCVRGLAVATAEVFLSCSNDATVRLWTNKGERLNTYYGHSNYIYSICINPGVPNSFTTCGEDGTVRLWSNGDCVREIHLPVQSVWSVTCLDNGDIVTVIRKPTDTTLKEYDYVFSVDIKDGAPPIKLPFNKTEDPWVAAQAFIHKNDLPQVYLEQVANFIITNAKLNTLPTPSNGYADPFTGESRYVPGSGPTTRAVTAMDPFTGAGAYTTAAASNTSVTTVSDKRYIPHDAYIRTWIHSSQPNSPKNPSNPLMLSVISGSVLGDPRCFTLYSCTAGQCSITWDAVSSSPMHALHRGLSVIPVLISDSSILNSSTSPSPTHATATAPPAPSSRTLRAMARRSSDGVIRVFTKDPARYADEATIKAFEEEVEKMQFAAKQEIGGYKLSDIPGPEVLLEAGKTDGQTKLVRRGTNVKCYSWSAAECTWNEVGDVMGAQPPTEGKTMYQGKEYDYVFSVDIKDGAPPIKLPFNKTEDPWVAAQAFIHKNDLPQVYLEQVANFIITNAKLNTLPTPSNGYADPFTGESRYVPGSGPTTRAVTAMDPFTGAGAYTTAAASNTSVTTVSDKRYIPHDAYIRSVCI
ncbi:Phospholipase A-2-activating protein [Papilio machaon]|uniref:Phospholipase A-2-activating protein n=1 Tax=Papilio machaon TaxID=76193 RepID=A0A0N1PHW2_PAPMA|nr:Phospholipase A-2-activating protein [Papilio machaon]